MPITKFQLKTPHLSLYLEEGKGIVFHKTNHCVFHLPTLSIAILFSIDDGDTKQTTLNNIANEYQLPKQQLEPVYKEIKTLFDKQKKRTAYLDGRYPEFESSPEQLTLIDNTKAAYFQIADTTFLINTQDKNLFKAIFQLLAPCNINSDRADFVLSIAKDQHSYQIFSNGILVEDELDFEHIMPLIIDRLQILSFQKSDYTFCFHGAALEMPRGTLLLPGKSGSGKSTLSAALVTKQCDLFSDEIIAMNKDFNLCVLSLPIAVKSGSWDSLASQYPTLKSAPTWHRLDGRLLKYIWPEPSKLQQVIDKHNSNNFLLINPQYICEPEPRCEFKRLNVIETITTLTESGYQLGLELNESVFEAFLAFIIKVPCYQLSYTNSQLALDKIDKLWELK
jgi:hypothetical protein